MGKEPNYTDKYNLNKWQIDQDICYCEHSTTLVQQNMRNNIEASMWYNISTPATDLYLLIAVAQFSVACIGR